MRKHSSLKQVYYISFSALIVIPILLVFFIALSVIRMMVLDSAVSAIQSAQSAVASSLAESVRDASLQLSHFVYVNDHELMRLAAMTDTADRSQRYHYTRQLDQLFEVAMAPKQTVVSGMIYMKDGSYTYLKQEVVIPREEISQTEWYRRANEKKNIVAAGCYDPSRIKLTTSGLTRKEMVIAVALSPDGGTDRSGKIDTVLLLMQARVGSMIQEFKKNPELGITGIIDTEGNLLFGADQEGMLTAFAAGLGTCTPGEYRLRLAGAEGKKQAYTGIISVVPGTDWQVFTVVETTVLTGEFNRIAVLLLVVIGALFGFYIIFSRLFLRTIITPLHTMVEGLHQVQDGQLETHIKPVGHYEIRTMIHSFNQMVRQLNTSIRENETAQQKKMEAEIQALQSQINPHFLVNTLNSIRFMAQVAKFDGIRRMAEALSRILACSFRSNHSFYTVGEELEMLDSYLYLMKIRYSDGFEVAYEIEDECRDCRVPRLILQPIVENSIVHGFVDMEEEIGRLDIRVFCDSEELCLVVEDNGTGLTSAEIAVLLNPERTTETDNYSIGISNVHSRLRLNFGTACSLTIESEAGQFCRTMIRLPILREKENKYEQGHYRG